MYRDNSAKPSILLLTLLMSFGTVGAILFTPGFPEIVQYFQVDRHIAHFVVTIYLLGFTFGQLIYGPLAHRIGNKKALCAGISLDMCGALICILAGILHLFPLLIVGRFIMSLGSSAGMCLSFALISQNFSPTESKKIAAYASLSFALAPSIGITIGGFLVDYFNWIACFIFLLMYGLFVLLLCLAMPKLNETLCSDDFATIRKNYWQNCQGHVITCGLILGCATSILYTFSTLAPFIGRIDLHLSASSYGLWNMLPPVGMLLGSLIAAHLATRVTAYRTMIMGISVGLLAAISYLLIFATDYLSVMSLFLPLAPLYLGNSMIYPNAAMIGIAQTPNKAYGSALMNFISLGFSVINLILVNSIGLKATLLLPIAILFYMLLSVSLIASLRS